METKPCGCGKKMILVALEGQLLTYPPQQSQAWWCYGCGAQESGPTIRYETKKEANRKRWEAAQTRTVWVGELRTQTVTLYWTGDRVTPNLEFVLTDDIHRARHFASQAEAESVLSAVSFWPRYNEEYRTEYRIEEHEIG